MKNNFGIFALIFEIIVVALLQLIPVNINAEILTINNQFIFGLVGSNSFVIIILLVALVFSIYLTAKSKKIILTFADGLLITGIASNLLDRVFRGGATDYISIGNWPTFNIADIFIVVGIVVLGLNYLFSSKEKT